MRRGIIGLIVGGLLAFALATFMNVYGLALIDWSNQDFLSAGVVNTTISTLLGGLAGAAFGFILDLEYRRS